MSKQPAAEYERRITPLLHHKPKGAKDLVTTKLDIDIEDVRAVNVDCRDCGCTSVANGNARPAAQVPAACECDCHGAARFIQRGAAS